MRSGAWSPASSETRTRSRRTRSVETWQAARSSRGPPSTGACASPTCCSRATTPGSASGAGSRPHSATLQRPTASDCYKQHSIEEIRDMNVIQQLEKEQQKQKVPALRAGDTVKVHAKVVEGTRERIQVFEGTVIRVTGGGLRQNFTVRRVTHGVGVERTFLIHSPRIDKIDVLRHGDVRQGRLYYLRGKVGKGARIRERRSALGTAAAPVEDVEPEENGAEAEE